MRALILQWSRAFSLVCEVAVSAPHEHGILGSKDNYAHPIPSPRERNQGAEYVMCILLGGARL